jgi:FAD/FMN-containing dehydrogenase
MTADTHLHRIIDTTVGGRTRREGVAEPGLDPRKLAAALRREIEGEVRFDDGDRALYATDASNYRQPPIGVVAPRSAEDVVRTVAVCQALGAPIVSRGGGTGLAGQTCNTAVVIDFSKYLNRIVRLDPEARLAASRSRASSGRADWCRRR